MGRAIVKAGQRFLGRVGHRIHAAVPQGQPHEARTNEDLACLAARPRGVRRLRIEASEVTDAGLAHLAGLTGLRRLTLSRNPAVTDAGLAHLGGLTALEALSLRRTYIRGDGLVHLRRLTRLRTLELDASTLTNRGLEHLGTLTQLRAIRLSRHGWTQSRGFTEDALSALRSALPHCDIVVDDDD